MKTLRGKTGFLVSLVLAICSLQTAYAQSVFLKYGPVAGIQKSTGSTYQNTAAASSDVIALFTGCSGVQYLGADGACHTYGGGTVTSVALTVPAGLTVTGSPITTSGTFAIATTLNGVLRGTGSGFTTAASTNIVGLWTGTCDATTFLRGDGACANPTSVPGGATTQVQYNNAGAFAGSADFTWADAAKTLTLNSTNNTTSQIKLGDNAAGAGRSISVTAGASTGANGLGGTLSLNGGFGNGSGQGGNVAIQAGDSGPTGTNTGGSVTIKGGRGQTPGPAFGGVVAITGGTVLADGDGGAVTINGAPGVGTNRNGGAITLTGGAATGTGTPGVVAIPAGNGVTVGSPTGGAKGVGTINATGLYINNVAVATGGSPGGANTNMQFNNGGAFGGDSGLTYAGAGGTITHTSAANSVLSFAQTNSSNGTAAANQVQLLNDASNTGYFGIAGTGNTQVQFLNGPTGAQVYYGTSTNIPVIFGQNNQYRFGLTSTVTGETARIITNGTGVTGQAYWAFYDQAGTRFGYFGKAGTTDGTVTYESDAAIKIVANNGVDSYLISTAHVPTFNGNLVPYGGRIIWAVVNGAAGSCTVVNSFGLANTTCTRSGVGAYTLNPPSGFANNTPCTASAIRANGANILAEADGSSSTIGISTYTANTGAAFEATSGVSVICVSST